MEASSPHVLPGKAPPRTKPVLVLGLGNDILSDDAVGLNVAREIRRHLSDSDGIEVQETSEMGLALLDHIVGFADLILVDAVQTRQAPPGFLHEFDGG
jgi:hydrogenase maturation protease